MANARKSPSPSRLAAEMLARQGERGGVVLILGGVDVGKSHLAGRLAARLAEAMPTAVVDADVGQSRIGPPATVGWAMAEAGCPDLASLPPRGTAFVGDVNPRAHLLPLAAATLQACASARRRAPLVLVDTCGLIDETAAALWWNVQRMAGVRAVLAIQRGAELEPMLEGLEGRDCWVRRIAPAESAASKTTTERTKYRLARFEAYFSQARRHQISLKGVAVQARLWGGFEGRLAALRNARGQDMALGIVLQWDAHESQAVLFAPPLNAANLCRIVIGDARPGVAIPPNPQSASPQQSPRPRQCPAR